MISFPQNMLHTKGGRARERERRNNIMFVEIEKQKCKAEGRLINRDVNKTCSGLDEATLT